MHRTKRAWFFFCAFVCPAHSCHQCAKLRIYIWVWLFLSAKTTGKGNVKPSGSSKNIGRSKKGCKNGKLEFILTFKFFTFRQTAFVCVCPLFWHWLMSYLKLNCVHMENCHHLLTFLSVYDFLPWNRKPVIYN